MNDCFTLDSLSPNSHSELGDYLYIKLKDIKSQNRPIIFLCIGTDRATGDSLGPLIGYKLKDLSQKNIYIYGSIFSYGNILATSGNSFKENWTCKY